MNCTSRNINIGISREKREVIDEIEKKLKDDGVYFHNEGGTSHCYNINAGFEDVEDSEWFEEWLKKKFDNKIYVETETF